MLVCVWLAWSHFGVFLVSLVSLWLQEDTRGQYSRCPPTALFRYLF